MEHKKYFTEKEKVSLQNIKGKYYDDSVELTAEEVQIKELDEVFFELSNQFMSTIAFIDKIMSVITKELDDFDELKDEKIIKKALSNQVAYVNSYSNLKLEFNEMIKVVYEFSKANNYYWKDCSVEVYIEYYEKLKENFLKENSYANDLDFLKFEYERLISENEEDEKASNSTFLNKDYFLYVPYRKYFTEENKTFFNLEKVKKIGFLKNELGQIGYGVELYTIGNSTKVKIIELESAKVERLSLSGLPNFNLRQRYELFRKLGFEDIITKLNTTKQMSRYKIIALIMGINPDNAKQLQNKTYSELKLKDTEDIKHFLDNQSIKL